LFPEIHQFAPFQLDHITAQKHHGPTVESNLAWSCFQCNNAKGTDLAGIDVETNQIVRLFHPRRDRWADHFVWEGALLGQAR